ncbi:conjugal transfer protein TraF [Vibrio sp. S4M6]|uniref:conjugal transfer protein TraF n=1 Tax=Vibrio sinus TaxID=2946865 RepID=UPI00202A8F74|nr:conjugal transfer protein TraF [Vibrio sinus]MCL9779832.1 conjugal transfer protein TraF [Vibrio sinus]
MKKFIKICTLSAGVYACSAYSAGDAIEARGDSMGGVGVVSANFLTAPFYNPAITAIYRRNDDAGMILPSAGLIYNDEFNMVDELKTAADLIKEAKGGDYSNISQLQTTLNALTGDNAKAELGGVVAFAIPNQYIALNVFGNAYAETFAEADIYNGANTGNSDTNTAVNAELSAVNAVSVAVTEVGISLAKYQTFLGQHLSFGVTPKIQRIYTYVYSANIESYDIKDVAKNSNGDTMFNMDAGMLWFRGPLRFGVAAMNLVSRDIATETITQTLTSSIDGTQSRTLNLSYSYEMRPLYTVGLGLVGDFASISVDYDLNEQERFTNFSDNTQMLRVGGELDIMRQLKLRAGYNKNLAYSNADDTYTAGLGIDFLNIVEFDLGVTYTNENAMGAFVNFLATY